MPVRNRTERRTVKGVAAVYLVFLAVAAIIVAYLAKYQIEMHGGGGGSAQGSAHDIFHLSF